MKKAKLANRFLAMVLAMFLVCGALPLFAVPTQAAGLSLKELQAKFPNEKYWNHTGSTSNNQNGWTNTACTAEEHKSVPENQTYAYRVTNRHCNGYTIGNSIMATQCEGFARKLGFDATGKDPGDYVYGSTSFPISKNKADVDNLKPGDIVRVGTHSIYITEVNGENVVFGDANGIGRCKIRWNAKTTKTALKTNGAGFGAFCSIRKAPQTLENGTTESLQNKMDIGGTLKLTQSYTITTPLLIKKTITIDLNGYNITAPNDYVIYMPYDVTLTLTDTSYRGGGYVEGKGGVCVNHANAKFILGTCVVRSSNAHKEYYALAVSNGTAQLDNGIIYKRGVGGTGTSVVIFPGGTVTMTGTDISGDNYNLGVYCDGKMTVKGGLIPNPGTGDAVLVCSKGNYTQSGGSVGAINLCASNVTISGGTIGKLICNSYTPTVTGGTIKGTGKLTLNDTYKFANNKSVFTDASCSNYGVSDPDFEYLINHVRNQHGPMYIAYRTRLQWDRASAWKDSTYGMAATVALEKTNHIALRNLRSDGTTMNNVPTPVSNPGIRSAINYYQISQYVTKIEGTADKGLTRKDNTPEHRQHLVTAGKSGLVFLEIYYKGFNGLGGVGHGLVLTDYVKGPGGVHRFIAYDPFSPDKRIFVDIPSDYSSMTVYKANGTSYGAIQEFDYAEQTKFGYFNWIDIDGPNNNLVRQSISAQAVGDEDFYDASYDSSAAAMIEIQSEKSVTIRNKENQTLVYDAATAEISPGSTMGLIKKAYLIKESKDGEPQPDRIVFIVPKSDKFYIQVPSGGMDISVASPGIFAAAKSNKANELVVEVDYGASLYGSGTFEYDLSLGVNASDLDMVSTSGTTQNATALRFKKFGDAVDNIAVKVTADFSQPVKLTTFSNTTDIKESYVTSNSSGLMIAGSSFGISGKPLDGELQIFGTAGDDEDTSAQVTVTPIESPHVHDITITGNPATCTEAGHLSYTCVGCPDSGGADYVTFLDEDALGHDLTFVPAEPNGAAPGILGINVCLRCGYEEKLYEELPGPDISALAQRLEELENVAYDNYTSESWGELQFLIENGYSALADTDSTQEQLDAALHALNVAYTKLEQRQPADMIALNTAIDKYKDISQGNYTDESWGEFAEALFEATIVQSDEYSSQEWVDAVLAALNAAYAQLTTAHAIQKPAANGSTNVTLEYKASQTLSVTGESVVWSSSNTKYVVVDSNTGKITSQKSFVKTGSALITAQNSAGKVEFNVKVKPSFGQWMMIIFLFGWIWM